MWRAYAEKHFPIFRRSTLKEHYSDHTALLTYSTMNNDVWLAASLDNVCMSRAASINYNQPLWHPTAGGMLLAHELGHQIGMPHDDSTSFGPYKCKMTPQGKDTKCLLGDVHERWPYFSSIGVNATSQFLARGSRSCLLNDVGEKEISYCGNGIVEDGEDCDCGNDMPCSACCNKATCKLAANAKCADGLCCDLATCTIKPKNATCRGALGSCDLAEYCDGTSRDCPADQYIQNGLPCKEGDEGYCYRGRCGSRLSECKKIWGETAQVAPDAYYAVNQKGKVNANCGFNTDTKKAVPCATKEDNVCGRLQCLPESWETVLHPDWKPIRYYEEVKDTATNELLTYVYSITIHNETLYTRRFQPGMALDGTKCGEGKACLRAKCVPLEQLRKNMKDCQCATNEVCTEQNVCVKRQ